jgi:uncharacterized membrane protein
MINTLGTYFRLILRKKITKTSVAIVVPYFFARIFSIPILTELLGGLFILLPGFILAKIIFKDVELIQAEMLIFIITLSIGLITLVMMTLNYSGIGITSVNLMTAISIEIVGLLLLFNYIEFKYF